MNPLRLAARCAVLSSLLAAAAAFAGPNLEGPAANGAAPQVSLSPQTVGGMADSVTRFFRPENLDPRPADLSAVVGVLQTVGRVRGPTRADVQPVIDRIHMAVVHFDGFDSSQAPPASRLASSIQLEVLAGPLGAWLSGPQRDLVRKKQAEYKAKLTSSDRARLSAKMKDMAAALQSGHGSAGGLLASVDARGAGPASAEKAEFWRKHGRLGASNANREIDGHDRAFQESVAPRMPVVLAQAEALAGARNEAAGDREFAHYVQRLDQDYYDQHGYYPGEGLTRNLPQRLRELAIHFAPIIGFAVLAGLLVAPHGVVILVLASRLGAGAAVVFLARRLRRKAFFDQDFKRPWLAMSLSIPVELLGWGSLISTLAVVAGLLPR